MSRLIVGMKVKVIDRNSPKYLKFGHITEAVIQGKKMKYFVTFDNDQSVGIFSDSQLVVVYNMI